jgi:hypothetical protein
MRRIKVIFFTIFLLFAYQVKSFGLDKINEAKYRFITPGVHYASNSKFVRINESKNEVVFGDILEWFGIIVAVVTSIYSLYRQMRTKAKLEIRTKVRQYDHKKGLNACIHPVNELVISIVNTSDIPLTIHSIKFVYSDKTEQGAFNYDNFSYEKRSVVEGKTLMRSEEVNIILSYLVQKEKNYIDVLEDIILISTYGHSYNLGSEKLKRAIKELKELPLPHLSNLHLSFENKR